MIAIAVLDDDGKDLGRVTALVEAFASCRSLPVRVTAFSNPFDLLDSAEKQGGFDVYLLDIVMAHLSGLDVAEELRKRGERAEIVFLTSSREYGVEAFAVNAAGYLLKPVSEKAFAEVLGRLAEHLAQKGRAPVLIRVNGGVRRVMTDEIVFIESFNHRREVTLTGGRTLSTPMTLSELGELLRPFPEFRSSHRAYLVNFNFVTGIGGAEVFVGEERIPIAKSGLRAFKEDYLEFCFSQ